MQMTALIVDDDRFIRQVLKDLMEGAGFRVLQAQDGEEGCRVAVEQQPDVILLDLVMPVLGGLDACRRLRALPQFKYTPILILTARTDLEGTVNPFQVGADDYLSKPFDGYELLARVHGNLVKKRALEAQERKAKDYEALLEITESVTSSLDTVEILRQIVNRIARLIDDVERCSIAVVQEDERYGYVLASSDDPGLTGLRIDLDRYPEIRGVVQSGRAVRVDDVSVDPLFAEVRPHLGGRGFNAILVLPVTYKQRVIGAMVVRAARSRASITQEEVEFCQLVANVSANALKNARFFAQIQEESDLLRNAKGCLEDELRLKAIYEKLFESASDGLAALDRKGRVVFANRRALQTVGCQREEVGDIDLSALVDLRAARPHLLRQLRAGAGEPFDVVLRAADGPCRQLSVTIARLPACGGLLVASFRDVTDRRTMERDLLQARAELEQANAHLLELDRLRTEFLNTATHELRIPVTVVNGYCTLLRDLGTDNFTPQQREFLEEAIAGSDRLVDMINNMLDLSRLEAGKMVMDIAPRDVHALLHEVGRGFRTMAENSALSFEVDAGGACLALCDDEKVHQVLTNLVGNAVKFTPAGGRIRLALEERDGEAVILVEDTGRGIPEDRITDLFAEFTQLGKGDSRRGSGLGLAICKKIVEAHRGSIWAESAPGQGSRFRFSLPKPA